MNTIDDLTKQEIEEINEEYNKELEQYSLLEDNLAEILDSKCSLSTKSIAALKYLISKLPNGEIRPQQLILIHKISNVIEYKDDGLMQAGTGVGKSIAYLIPAIISKRKCFVSTSTIQLTSQLADKDLPTLKKYLFPELEYLALQSLSNYICPRKMTELLDELHKDEKIFMKSRPEEYKSLQKVVPQYEEYLKGSIKEEYFTIDSLGCNCESFSCAGSNCIKNCKFEGRNSCPVYKIVNRAYSSNVVITNHAYISRMIVDASKQRDKNLGVLKSRYLWICDEAHDLDNWLEKAFSTEVTQGELKYNLLAKLNKYVNETKIEDTFSKEYDKYNYCMQKLKEHNPDIRDIMYQSGNDVKQDVIELGVAVGRLYNIMDKYRQDIKEKIEIYNTNSTKPITSLEDVFEFEKDDIETISKDVNKLLSLKVRLDTLSCVNVKYIPTVKRILDTLLEIERIFNLAYIDKNSYVTYFNYIETDKESVEPFKISATYLNTGDALQAGLGFLDGDKSNITTINENKVNLIGVSATLCVENSFRDSADKLGMLKLKDIKCQCSDVGTVFDYPKQGLMYIPQNIPDVKTKRKEHFDYFKSNVKTLIEASNGGALILCTTSRETSETYTYLLNELGDKYTILCADDKRWKNKNELVTAFREDTNSVLVGTRGFFQGLDVQGDSLRLLCLNKLPFGNPGVVSKRKSEIAESKGLDAFRVTAVVPTTMMLLQAIGRLIRHTSDKGVVAIFDNRLYSGVRWLSPVVRSLPPFTAVDTVEDVEEFFTNNL